MKVKFYEKRYKNQKNEYRHYKIFDNFLTNYLFPKEFEFFASSIVTMSIAGTMIFKLKMKNMIEGGASWVCTEDPKAKINIYTGIENLIQFIVSLKLTVNV